MNSKKYEKKNIKFKFGNFNSYYDLKLTIFEN